MLLENYIFKQILKVNVCLIIITCLPLSGFAQKFQQVYIRTMYNQVTVQAIPSDFSKSPQVVTVNFDFLDYKPSFNPNQKITSTIQPFSTYPAEKFNESWKIKPEIFSNQSTNYMSIINYYRNE